MNMKTKKRFKEADDRGMIDFGIAIMTPDEREIQDIAEDFELTIDWDILNDDIRQIKINTLKILKFILSFCSDEGHDGNGNLICSASATVKELRELKKYFYGHGIEKDNTILLRDLKLYSKITYHRLSDEGVALLSPIKLEIFYIQPEDLDIFEDIF